MTSPTLASSSAFTSHLLVLVHGMWGAPIHLSEIQRIIVETKGEIHTTPEGGKETLDVLVANSNMEEHTYDGIDWGAQRIVTEIENKVKEIEDTGRTVIKFSIAGYSLGGLLSRYVIGLLYHRNFFHSRAPVNFTTFATPHIGLLRYPGFFSTMSHWLGPTLLSRTGTQFYAADRWGGTDKPLIEIMADPSRVFYKALASFQQITFFANVVNDLTVPYITAAAEPEDPFYNHGFNGIKIEFKQNYEPLIESWSFAESGPLAKPKETFSLTKTLEKFKPSRWLPPFLQRKFPLNIIIVLIFPILFPSMLCLFIFRMYMASRSSSARIKLMEGTEGGSGRAFVDAVARLEKEIEDVVVDMMESGDTGGASSSETLDVAANAIPNPPIAPTDLESSTKVLTTSTPTTTTATTTILTPYTHPNQPTLTPLQHRVIANLNTLPHLRKERAFIDPLRNSHATIICRDVKNFEFHRRGEGVVRFWADGFVL